MKDENKTKEQLIEELVELRSRNAALESVFANHGVVRQGIETRSQYQWFSTGRSEIYVTDPVQKQFQEKPIQFRFSDLVDIQCLQQLLNSFYMATGIPYGLHDEENNVISGIGWQDICALFHRKCPETYERCQQSDAYIAAHLHEEAYIGYKCLNGLMDYGTPIVVEGQHLGGIFLGQLLHEPPDEDFFRQQAQEHGFDENAYMEALRRVPIISEERVGAIMAFYSKLGQMLIAMGLERKRKLEEADKIIKDREERLRLVWATHNDGFWDWNTVTGEVYYSPRWAEMLGYSPEELEPCIHAWERLVHPDDKTAMLQAINDHLLGKTTKFEMEYRMLTKSREWKWVMSRGRVVERDAAGQSLSMAGIHIDLTDLKRAETAMRQSHQKFLKAFQYNPDPMAITILREGRFVEVNDAFVTTSGFTRQETIGRTVYDLKIWVNFSDRKRLFQALRENGSIRDFEVELRLKNGEIRTFCLSGEIFELDGKPHFLKSCKDITESKRIQDQIRLSEELFSKAFNTSPIPMVIISADDQKYIMVNMAYCHCTGYSYEDTIGHTPLELGFFMKATDYDQAEWLLLTNQSVRDMEIMFRNKKGEQRLGLISTENIVVDGRSCILGILVDITEQRKMEIEMTRLDRLNLVGEMSASIGHEIRNPMTTVRGYLQLLREREDYQPDKNYFDLMIEELDRANSIITEFLSLAKNKMVDMTRQNLNVIISKSLPLIEASALSRNQYIYHELNDLPDLLLDKEEIHQLILNMLKNGLESMSSTGAVTIKTLVENENALLVIEDQGSGIDRAVLDKLGTPFFTTKENGTGLGLAVCYRIAARHNATIDVKTSSKGTAFFIRFPIPQ